MRILNFWPVVLAFAMLGCEQRPSSSNDHDAAPLAEAEKVKSQSNPVHSLTIYGYNYTNRYIDQFEVDGQGGGNLDPSNFSAGGGKGACCMGWRDGTHLPQTVHIRWVAGGCVRTVTNSSGESREVVRHLFKETDVVLSGPVPADPGYFEVHFFPDEHIEVAITSLPSEPRLRLDPGRAVDPYPEKCKAEK